MNKADKYRLDVAKRRAKGKLCKSKIEQFLSCAFQIEKSSINFLSVEENDRFRQEITRLAHIRVCYLIKLTETNIGILETFLNMLKQYFPDGDMYFMYNESDMCGMALINGWKLLDGVIKYTKLRKGTLCAAFSMDARKGFELSADNEYHYEEGNNTWRLEYWGIPNILNGKQLPPRPQQEFI